jgi:hypothetical protein
MVPNHGPAATTRPNATRSSERFFTGASARILAPAGVVGQSVSRWATEGKRVAASKLATAINKPPISRVSLS